MDLGAPRWIISFAFQIPGVEYPAVHQNYLLDCFVDKDAAIEFAKYKAFEFVRTQYADDDWGNALYTYCVTDLKKENRMYTEPYNLRFGVN